MYISFGAETDRPAPNPMVVENPGPSGYTRGSHAERGKANIKPWAEGLDASEITV